MGAQGISVSSSRRLLCVIVVMLTALPLMSRERSTERLFQEESLIHEEHKDGRSPLDPTKQSDASNNATESLEQQQYQQQDPQEGNTLLSPDDVQMDMTFFPVISMPRSSSSYLANVLMRGSAVNETLCPYQHFVPLKEIFIPVSFNSGNAWAKDAKKHLFENELKPEQVEQLSGEAWSRFIVAVARRRCRELALNANRTIVEQRLSEDPSCPEASYQHQHCLVTFKLFSIHRISTQASKKLWRVLPNPKVMVVLERAIEDRWKSWWFALKTGDWNGDAKHREAISEAEPPPVDESFRNQHEKWYELVKNEAETNGDDGSPPFGGAPVVYLTFDEVVSDPRAQRKRLLDLAREQQKSTVG